MDLSVVVPVFNEADNIRPLLEEIRAALEGRFDYEVIYVDDGSRDVTLTQLRDCRYEFPRLRILSHAASCGQSAAIRSGVRAAHAPWIATLDGDGQNDPADIPPLWARLRADQGSPPLWLIAGWRRQRRDSAAKRLASRVANGVRRRLLGDDTPDTGCGLKLFRRDVFLELPDFDHMHRFLPALVQRAGGRVVSVTVNHRPRARGQSKYGVFDRLWVGIVDLCGVAWLQRRAQRPLVSEVDAE
ncbi:glycosyltransferase [Thiohalobacter thiocyanaticus]|uniref:Glycosyltransferase n=1 Tax=Thiohalobacter thiocyanaticus TaxID=585455 RepID=A0A1Z4VUY4_9GAMM|nr:glycosyltransferase family 2 protein [Thiohalobacter thiocyanaticus]BAZ95252.1 glycosyltransferase [Thiohalobacter thiocyanaticus]